MSVKWCGTGKRELTQLFRSDLKFTAKQLSRESAKMEKKEKEERKKIKTAIEKGIHFSFSSLLS